MGEMLIGLYVFVLATLAGREVIKRFVAPDMGPALEQLVCRATVAGLSVVTLLLALTVQGILRVLLIGLTLATAYTLLVLMTLYWPRACRRSSASWTLASTMVALALWQLAPPTWRVLPHRCCRDDWYGSAPCGSRTA